ncbi:MAG TPA: S1 RNA-binding domain-containing protein [Anaerolineaceae bacterium]
MFDQNDAQQLEQGATPENNSNENNNNMASLLEQEGLGIDFPIAGEIRHGVIASINPGQILVSVGTKSEGMITGKEYEQIPTEELQALKVGQEIPVFVINPEDQDGNLVLSYVRAREEVSWQQVETLRDSKETTHSSIVGYNKGGLIVPVGGLRGFVPASQISLSRRASLSGDSPEQKWSKMIGQTIDVCVIEVDRERRRLILSERQASTETRESIKEKVIDELKEGEIRTGRVTSLADFGAFVNISGADGLVHLSEISWERINHPNEVLKVGQEVKVKVISIDREKKRIGLSIRSLQSDPWMAQAAKYQVGQLVEASITRLTKFGAFARLEKDLEGLIHISELSEKRIEHPKEVLHEGDIVTLRVIKIDPDNHRIGLSLRRVESMAYADLDWQSILESEMQEEDKSKPEEEQPVVEQPAGEQPVVEQLAAEKPAAKKSAAEKPAVEQPTAEKSVAEKPTAEKPAAVKLAAKKPTAEKPAVEQPTAEKSVAEKPAAVKLAAKKPTAEKPADEKPTAEKPADEKPAVKKPAAKKPAAEKLADEKPTVEKPAAKKPAAKKPAAEKPAAEKLAAEKPAVEKPAV